MNPVLLGALGTVFGVVIGAPVGIWLKHWLDTRREREAHRRQEDLRRSETQERVLEDLGNVLKKLRRLSDEPVGDDAAARQWADALNELMEDARYSASRIISVEHRARFTVLDTLAEWQLVTLGGANELLVRATDISERELRLALVAECLNVVASGLRGEKAAPAPVERAEAALRKIAEFQDYLALRDVMARAEPGTDLTARYRVLERKYVGGTSDYMAAYLRDVERTQENWADWVLSNPSLRDRIVRRVLGIPRPDTEVIELPAGDEPGAVDDGDDGPPIAIGSY